MRRKGTNNQWFNQRIPADVRGRATGLKLEIPLGLEIIPLTISAKADAVRLSLRSSVPAEVKARQAQVAVYLEGVWQALRSSAKPVELSHKQAVALSREVYDAWAADASARQWTIQFEADGSSAVQRGLAPAVDPEIIGEAAGDVWLPMGEPLEFKRLSVVETEALSHRDLEVAFGARVDQLLGRKGIFSVDALSRDLLLMECLRAFRDGEAQRQRQLSGDYSIDPKASRFPQWEGSGQSSKEARGSEAVSLTGLVDGWWTEAKAAGRSRSTHESYRGAFSRLAAFLEHDDATRVSPADIVQFKDHRLSQGISISTVGDSDFGAFRSVFQWAVDNLKIDTNPAEKARVKRNKPTKRRDKSFTPEEATAILRHTLSHQGNERPKTKAAKRWVPWLCAYTGARLGEMVQLRKQDLRRVGDLWVLTITPEAGTVKDKEVREVVLHADLIERGFAAFVTGAADGYLFLNAKLGDDIRGVWRSIKNRVTEFVREVVTDRDVAPNHGWRHLFKRRGRDAGVEDTVLDAICGHAAKTVGDSYGEVTLKAQALAMAKFPKFTLDPSPDAGGALTQ